MGRPARWRRALKEKTMATKKLDLNGKFKDWAASIEIVEGQEVQTPKEVEGGKMAYELAIILNLSAGKEAFRFADYVGDLYRTGILDVTESDKDAIIAAVDAAPGTIRGVANTHLRQLKDEIERQWAKANGKGRSK